jgi:hypothetical protein
MKNNNQQSKNTDKKSKLKQIAHNQNNTNFNNTINRKLLNLYLNNHINNDYRNLNNNFYCFNDINNKSIDLNSNQNYININNFINIIYKKIISFHYCK